MASLPRDPDDVAVGLGDMSGAGFTVSPGTQNGVVYDKPYEGKYWSSDSYAQRMSGESEFKLGAIVGGAGLVAVIIGVVLSPGPFENPPVVGAVNARLDGLHTTLLSARF